MKKYLSIFLNSFLSTFNFIGKIIFGYDRWYCFVFWFIVDIFFIYDSYTLTMKDPSDCYIILIWGVNLGLHIWLGLSLFSKWRLKRKGFKEYVIIDRGLQNVVDTLDQYDSSNRLFENGTLKIDGRIYDPKKYKCHISTEELTETINSQQETN